MPRLRHSHVPLHAPEHLEDRSMMAAADLVPAAMQETAHDIDILLAYHLPSVDKTALPALDTVWDATYRNLDTASNTLDATRADHGRIAITLREETAALLGARATLDTDLHSLQDLSLSIGTITDRIGALQKKQEKRTKDLAAGQEQHNAYETSIAAYHATLNELLTRKDTLLATIADATSNIASLTKAIEDFDALLASSALRAKRYAETKEAWYQQTDEIRDKRAHASEEKSAEQRRDTSARIALLTVHSDIVTTNDSLDALRLLLDDVKNTIVKARQDIVTLQGTIDDNATLLRTAKEHYDTVTAAVDLDRSVIRSREKTMEPLTTEEARVAALVDASSILTEALLSEIIGQYPQLQKAYDAAYATAEKLIPRTRPLPIDAAWPLTNAPAGSKGMLPHPGAGNDYGIDISPDGKRIVVGSQSSPYPVLVLDAVTGAIVQRLPQQGVISVEPRFSPDGSMIITSSYDGVVRIFDSTSGTLLRSVALPGLATSLDVSIDGTIAVELSEKGLFTIDATTGVILSQTSDVGSKPSFSASGLHMVYGNDRDVHIVFRPTKTVMTVPLKEYINDTVISTDERTAVIATSAGNLWSINLATGAIVDRLEGDGSTILRLASGMGRIVSGGIGFTKEYSIDRNGHLKLLTNHDVPGAVYGIDVSPSSQTYVVNAAVNHPGISKLVKFPLRDPLPYILAPGTQERDATALLAVVTTSSPLLRETPPASLPASRPLAERINALRVRGEWIQHRIDTMNTIEKMASAILLAPESETSTTLAQNVIAGLRTEHAATEALIGTWQKDAMLLSMEQDRFLARTNATNEPRVPRTDTLTLSPLSLKAGDDRIARTTLSLPALGGNAILQSLSGKAKTTSTLQATSDNPARIDSLGAGLVVDLSTAESLVQTINMKVSTTAPTVKILAIGLDGTTVKTIDANTNTDITITHTDGLMGVIVVAPVVPLSAEGSLLADHLSRGGDIDGFFRIRPDLLPKKNTMVTEVNAGTRYMPLSTEDVRITGTIALPQGGTHQPMEPFTSAAYSALSAPAMKGIYFPDNYRNNLSVVYGTKPDQYTGLRPYVYGASPRVDRLEYPYAMMYGQLYFTSIPKEFFRMIGDTMVLAPLGQDLRLGIVAEEAQVFRTNLPVGYTYDFSWNTTTGSTVTDVLPKEKYRLNASLEQIVTVNAGQPGGTWVSGKQLSYSGSTPVALGTLRAFTSYLNEGTEPLDVVISVYSGYAGTPGWDQEQARYTTTIGPGQSKQLWVQASMIGDAKGASTFHIIVRNKGGLVLSDFSRPVAAPGSGSSAAEKQRRTAEFMSAWNTAMTQAAKDTKTYLESIGVANVPKSAFDVPPPAVIVTPSTIPTPEAERLVRIAFRTLRAAEGQGNAEAIGSARTMLANALTNYGTAIGLERSTADAAAYITRFAESTQANLRAEEIISATQKNILAYHASQQQQASIVTASTITHASLGSLLADIGGMSFEELANYRVNLPATELWSPDGLGRHTAWTNAIAWLRQGEASSTLDASTIAGRVALGLALRATESTKVAMSQTAASVLGIDYHKILAALHGVYPAPVSIDTERTMLPSTSVRIAKLSLLLRDGQYTEATKGAVLRDIGTPHPDKNAYNQDDTEMIVRFDLPASLATMKHASLYLANNGIMSLPTSDATKLATIQNALEFRVPMATVNEIIGTAEPRNVQLLVQVLDADGTTIHRAISSDVRIEGYPQYDFSTMAPTLENASARAKENAVINIIARQPVFERKEGRVHVIDMGSDRHDDAGFQAIDINTFGNDVDQPILSPSHGYIDKIDRTNGTVIINHDGGWQSIILHMPLYTSSIIEGMQHYVLRKKDGTDAGIDLYEKQEVFAGSTIGIVGGRGPTDNQSKPSAGVDEEGARISDAAYEPHIHYEARIDGQSIDLTRMIESHKGWNIGIYGNQDLARITAAPLHWSEVVDANDKDRGLLVNDEHRVIFYRNRDVKEDAKTNFFVAWEIGKKPEEMERVVWEYVGEDINKKKIFAWTSVHPINGNLSIWREKNGNYSFVSIDAFKKEMQIL